MSTNLTNEGTKGSINLLPSCTNHHNSIALPSLSFIASAILPTLPSLPIANAAQNQRSANTLYTTSRCQAVGDLGTQTRPTQPPIPQDMCRLSIHSKRAMDGTGAYQFDITRSFDDLTPLPLNPLPLPRSFSPIPFHFADDSPQRSTISSTPFLPSLTSTIASPETPRTRRQYRPITEQEKFYLFFKMLLHYVDQTGDPRLRQQTKAIVGKCVRRNRRGVVDYLSLQASIEARLRHVVGDQIWTRAKLDVDRFMDKRGIRLHLARALPV